MVDNMGLARGGLRDYLKVIRRHRWMILCVGVLGAVLAVGYSLHQGTLYQANAEVLLNRTDAAAPAEDSLRVCR